jgi:hypothetical protein
VGEDTLLAGTKIGNSNANGVPTHPLDNDHDKHIRDTKRTIEESPDDEKSSKRAKRRTRLPVCK